MAWLRGKTGLLSNPGLNPRVRADAIALAKINGDWMNAFRQSQINDHIVRRYVATPTGVLRMFPGTLLSKAYNPLEQRWYTRALQHPGKVVFTGPYLDVGGAGYVVSFIFKILASIWALEGKDDIWTKALYFGDDLSICIFSYLTNLCH